MIIIWSEKAEQRVMETLGYLEENFSLRSAQKLHTRLWEALSKAKDYPETGRPSSKAAGVRSIKIDKYRRLFYLLNSTTDTLIVLDIFDNRQNPDKLHY